MRMRSCGELGRVFDGFTAGPTDEERNPQPFRLRIVRQVRDARECLLANMPSGPTTIKASLVATATLVTLAVVLLRRSSDLADGDPTDDVMPSAVTRLNGGAVMLLVAAAFCLAACLFATTWQCASNPQPDARREDA
jgi:hypothetical protein